MLKKEFHTLEFDDFERNLIHKRRHLASIDVCASCHSVVETIEYVLRASPRARQIWESIVRPDKVSTFFSIPFTDWLLQCVSSIASIVGRDEPWAT
ncbi:hypothetical protein V6N13_074482 [Hibiscus sabdariffa]